jgi:hypothetical protein
MNIKSAKEKKLKNIEAMNSKNEKLEKLKEIIKHYSFFLKNSYDFSYPSKEGNYRLFPRKGLKKQEKMKISPRIKEKIGNSEDYI